MEKTEQIKEQVRQCYGKVVEETCAGRDCGNVKSCCGASAKPDVAYAEELGYSKEECAAVPLGANMGLGCGNPTAIADLMPGEVVVDLGSGGGFDCFLAAKKVGAEGRVIGVDMTPVMVSKARLNAASNGYDNVEFRLGEIEYLPIANEAADVIISNCVINLSTNKAQVFREMSRILKRGGRIAISDTVASRPLPQSIKNDLQLHVACIAGALSVDEIKRLLADAGFHQTEINVKEASRSFIQNWAPGSNAEDFVAEASIKAVKL